MTASNRPVALLGVLVVEALLAVPITIALGSLGVYFLATASGALTTGILGVTGIDTAISHPASALLIAPVSAAVGAIAFAGLMGYFWIIARTLRRLRLRRPHP